MSVSNNRKVDCQNIFTLILKFLKVTAKKYLLSRQSINMTWLNSSDKKMLQNHLPSDSDYLLMLLDFMAIVLLSLTRRGK